jgi:TolA-binding protein
MRLAVMKLSRLILLPAIVSAMLATTANAQGDADYQRRRSQMRADFERMRNQHRQQFSPQGREFLRKMDQRYQQQESSRQAAAQAQIRAAANMPAGVTPSACALAYEQALHDATRYDQIRPFFTEHYYNVYISRKNPAEQ